MIMQQQPQYKQQLQGTSLRFSNILWKPSLN